MSEEDARHISECRKTVLERPSPRRLPPGQAKKSFAPVNQGLTADEAIREARRCLALQPCEGCDVCSLLCPDLCITKDPVNGQVLIDLDYCKGCGICAAFCPKGAIKMEAEL